VESTQKVQTAPYASTIANVNKLRQRCAACKNFLDSNQDCTKAYTLWCNLDSNLGNFYITSYIKYSSATLFQLIVPARNRQNLKKCESYIYFLCRNLVKTK